MKIGLCTAVILLSNFLFAQNGLECIVVEKYYITNANDTIVNETGGVLPVGSVTYRLYADMLPGYKFQAAYGVDVAPAGVVSAGDHELRLQTSTLFFNNEDRGATTPNFTKARCADNTVMLDSWLSVGAAAVGNYGILKSKDNGIANVVNGDGILQNNDADMGIPLTTQDGLIVGSPQSVTEVGITNEILVFDNQNDGTNGPLFSTYNGSWSCLGGCMGPDTVDNKVLIAQITTDGIFTYELNIQIGTPTGGVERYVARNPYGDEISLPCLIDTFGLTGNVAPVVSITAPSDGATYGAGNNVAIAAAATDADGTISQVEFFVDGNSVGVDSTVSFNTNWTAVLGVHDITAIATDNSGAQTTSQPISITVNTTSGVKDAISAHPIFSVYPNPTNGFFAIEITTPVRTSTCSYAIYDVQGKLMWNKSIEATQGKYTEQINLSSLASGIYFAEVTADGIRAAKKIIKD